MAVHWNGQALRHLRNAQGLTQYALAVKVDCPSGGVGIYRWESGRVTPSAATVITLARALNVRPEAFFAEGR